MDARILYSTWPDDISAAACARVLVEEGLAACVTLLAGGRSIYRWAGAIEDSPETIMLAKTRLAVAAAAKDRILALHPYDLPCVLALTPEAAGSNDKFIEWVCREAP